MSSLDVIDKTLIEINTLIEKLNDDVKDGKSVAMGLVDKIEGELNSILDDINKKDEGLKMMKDDEG